MKKVLIFATVVTVIVLSTVLWNVEREIDNHCYRSCSLVKTK